MNRGALCGMLLTLLASQSPLAADPYQPKDIPEPQYTAVLEARSARLAGNPGVAVQQLERVVSERPNYFLARYNLGLSYDAMGRAGDAVAQLSQAKQLDEQYHLGDVTIYNALGTVYIGANRFDDALRELQTARHHRIHPSV
jgi:Flp pilus assembly protein TadD